MNEIKQCFKCGIEERKLLDYANKGLHKKYTSKLITHHLKYDPEIIVNCCRSCHRKIHHRIRKSNACKYSVDELNKMSEKSSIKRTTRAIQFYEQLSPNVRLMERIVYNLSTGNVGCSISFFANHGFKLYKGDI